MELKALADDESSRKRHHMRNKLRKASKKASELIAVLSEMGEGVDARTNLETQVWFFFLTSSLAHWRPLKLSSAALVMSYKKFNR